MTPERWHQIKVLFDGALNLSATDRLAFLGKECAGDDDLRAEVESLLASHDEADGLMDDLVMNIADGLLFERESEPNIGRRLGQYKVIREIGQGGMGHVFLGVRADDQFQKQVAIKLIRSGLNSDFLIRRFRTERQILANLDHPNIARLLDGGTTDNGMPYLVMEYIDGRPIDEYCDGNHLTTVDRLTMFRQVCSAVHYAHQNLVVHRDIKPSNILVTRDGTPKLLDFGIAKLLDPAHLEDETGTAMGLMTPEYASPEQVRGLSITTATDVYSLGVVLYRLLSGHHPYRIRSRTPEEILRIVCQEDPLKPSAAVTRVAEDVTAGSSGKATIPMDEVYGSYSETADKLRRRLSGDLDMIVMMAMRKEPDRRYQSVEQFSEDIRRHLEGLPVMAAKNTFRYHASKFIGRHKIGLAAAALIVIAIAAGGWQAFSAHTEKKRAESVSNNLSTVVESLMFQVDDKIQDLEGATPARQLLVTKALGYLDSLAAETKDDRENSRRLAAAYIRVADIQGRPGFPNIGDKAGALSSYQKGLDILQSLASDQRAPQDFSRDLATCHERIADVLRMTGKSDLARDQYQKALALREQLINTSPSDDSLKSELGGNYQRLGDLVALQGNAEEALKLQRKGLAIMEELSSRSPADPDMRRTLVISYIKVGDMQQATGDAQAAIDSYRKAVPICRDLSDSFPSNSRYRRLLTISYDKVGNGLSAIHDPAAALEFYRKSLEVREALSSADPLNAEARRDLSVSYDKMGGALSALGNARAALDYYKKALANDLKLHNDDPKNAQAYSDLTDSIVKVADMQLQAKATADALEDYRHAIAIREELVQADPQNADWKNDLLEAYSKAAGVYSSIGSDTTLALATRQNDWRQARDLYQKGLTLATALRDSHSLAKDSSSLPGDFEHQLTKCDEQLSRLSPPPK